MQYQILVQSQPNQRFTAAVLGLPGCIVEGSTKDEAVTNATLALQEQLANSEIVTIEVSATNGNGAHPLLKHFGALADDPTFDDWQEKIAEFRRQTDEEEALK
jgi:predicted RNase H-like HicB family nuclease